MADYQTMTPGSAVAETVQALLQRKREEQRQMILDQLTMEKFRQDQTEQDRRFGLDTENDAVTRKLQGAQTADVEEDTIGKKLKTLPQNKTPMANIGDESLQNVLINRGLTVEETPQLSPSNAPTSSIGPDGSPVFRAKAEALPQRMFIGSGDFQKAEDAKRRAEELATGPAVSDRNPVSVAARAAGAGVNLPAQALPNVTSVIGPQDRGKKIEGRVADETVEIGYPPVGPSALVTPQQYVLPNPRSGQQEAHWLLPGQQPTDETLVRRDSLPINDPRKVGTTLPPGTPATLSRELAEAARDYQNQLSRGNEWFGLGGEREGVKITRAYYEKILGAVLNTIDAPPDYKEVAIDIVVDPTLSTLSASEALRHPRLAQIREGYNPEAIDANDISAIDQLLNVLRGASAAATAPAAPIVQGGRGAGAGQR